MSYVVSRTPNPSTQPKPRPMPSNAPTPPPMHAAPRRPPAPASQQRPAAPLSRPMLRVAPLQSSRAAKPTPGEIARLAAFALAGGLVAMLYVVLPLVVTLRAALPFLANGVILFLVALALVALGEFAVVRILLRTTPPRAATEAPRRAPAFTGPFGFDVEVSDITGGAGVREFPSLGRGIPVGADLLLVRVGSDRWRDHQGHVALKAYLPGHLMRARAQILRAEDAPVHGRAQCVLHLRLVAMSAEDERHYRAALS